MAAERLQKLIAQAGVTSRRDAENYITTGRVAVNGKIIRTLGAKADPTVDDIAVDGVALNTHAERIIIMMHKPEKTIVSVDDPQKRATVMELLAKPPFNREGPKELPRVFPIGRLDYDAQGLLLLTNDGELSAQLIHPRYRVPKTYLVKVSGVVEDKGIRRMENGIALKDLDGRVKKSLPAVVSLHRTTDRHAWYSVTIFEGRNHLIKRLFAAVNHPVRRILRIEFAGLSLGDLPEGEWRQLNALEEQKLRQWTEIDPAVEPKVTVKAKVSAKANGPRKTAQAQGRSGQTPSQRASRQNPRDLR